MEFHYSPIPIPIAAGRTNTALRSMEPGLTTAAFGTKAQSAITNKNAELRREISSSGDKMTVTDTSGSKHRVATKQTTTTVTRPAGSKSSRETTPTRTFGKTVRSEPLKHTLVRQMSPAKIKGLPPRTRSKSPTGDNGKNGQKATKGSVSSERK